MTLSALIQKRDAGKLATAIPAISAIHGQGELGKVARVATVTVANDGEPTSLTFEEERYIRIWLRAIEEHRMDVITDVLKKCCDDKEALLYFLSRSKEMRPRLTDMHSCNDCRQLTATGVCLVATRIGAVQGYKPVLGRRFDHRCSEWEPP